MILLNNMGHFIKKVTKFVFVLVTIAVAGYITWLVYDKINTSVIERKIREAGLDPKDYDLRGIAPWNIREFVTNKELEKIEKSGIK